MDAQQMQVMLDQQAMFMRETVERQAAAHNQAMAAMAEMVRSLQHDLKVASEQRSQPREKDGLTTKRAFSMLPHYSGKVEDFDTWRFQMTQFLAEDPYFVKLLEWIENDLDGEDQHASAIQEKNTEHNNNVDDAIDMQSSPTRRTQPSRVPSTLSLSGTINSCTRCLH
jgi:hypothetical protein